MSTNLRLSDDMARALRQAAEARGQSQQDVIRAALAKDLGLAEASTSLDHAVQSGLVKAPQPFQDVVATVSLPDGVTTLDLLDRDDR